jgi:hypothetical protein
MKFSGLATMLLLFALLPGVNNAVAAETGSIKGNVYCDKDKNGTCDCEEGGLADINMQIFTQHCGGTALQSVSTDKKGNFTFQSFAPGTYFIMADLDYVCGGRVPTTPRCQQVKLGAGQ